MTSGHSHDDRDPRPDDGLAQAVRSAHAASLDHLSPRVRAQLAQRRRAALAEHGRPHAPRRWPMIALGSAAALTLAIGLFAVRNTADTVAPSQGTVAVTPTGAVPTPAEPATAPAEVAPVVAATDPGADTPDPAVDSIVIDDALPDDLLATEFSGGDEAMGFDALEESPDFYLWLGSDSAQTHGSELL